MATELRVIDETYELILWTHRHITRFPRHSRFSIDGRLESGFLNLLDKLLEAKFSKNKLASLREASLQVEQIRFLFRLVKDTRLLSFNSHRHAVSCLNSIGKQLHGWKKQQQIRNQ